MYEADSVEATEKIKRGCSYKARTQQKTAEWKTFFTNEDNKTQLVQIGAMMPMPTRCKPDLEGDAYHLTLDDGTTTASTTRSTQEETGTMVVCQRTGLYKTVQVITPGIIPVRLLPTSSSPISSTVPFRVLPFRLLYHFIYCPTSSTPILSTVPLRLLPFRLLPHFVYSYFVYFPLRLLPFCLLPTSSTPILSTVPLRLLPFCLLSHFVYSHFVYCPTSSTPIASTPISSTQADLMEISS